MAAAVTDTMKPGKEVTNWNITIRTAPAVMTAAKSVADVQRVVKDTAGFPTPILPVGTMHSVTECVTNDGGTILNISALNKIKGLEGNVVRVETGVKLADLHDWLAEKDLEISFSPEIGDATVGSLVVSTSKDSSIDGLGYLSALVREVTYVNEVGELVTLTLEANRSELIAFTCSYGAMGVVVEATLEVRKRIMISSHIMSVSASSGAEAARKLRKLRSTHDTLFAILVPSKNYVFVEARKKVPRRSFTPLSMVGMDIAVKVKYNCFLNGAPPGKALSSLLRANFMPFLHYRRQFVNRYPAVTSNMRRLDFSFFEFDFESKFDEVVAACWDFSREFKAKTGFAPAGYAMYFCTRPGDKPSASFSGPAGTSFMVDPITGHCDDPRWLQFCEQYNTLALHHKATVSLSQTKCLKPGQASLPAELTRERFLTPFFKQFVHGTAKAT